MGIIAPGGGEIALGRGEFSVLLALIGLAQEGDAISLDSVDERRRSTSLHRFHLPSSRRLILSKVVNPYHWSKPPNVVKAPWLTTLLPRPANPKDFPASATNSPSSRTRQSSQRNLPNDLSPRRELRGCLSRRSQPRFEKSTWTTRRTRGTLPTPTRNQARPVPPPTNGTHAESPPSPNVNGLYGTSASTSETLPKRTTSTFTTAAASGAGAADTRENTTSMAQSPGGGWDYFPGNHLEYWLQRPAA